MRDHLRHNVVGYIALFCFVLGGTAVALPGHNKVDTGDLKKNAVRTSDIAPRAVTAAKIAPRSVDSLRVIDDSLGGQDIDESTLNIRTAPNSIGPTELADRQRRLVFAPGSLVPAGSGAPVLTSAGVFPVLDFPDEPGSAALATDVPGSRIEGTSMTVRVLWSPIGDGAVAWNMTYGVDGPGDSIDETSTPISQEISSAADDVLTGVSFEIPASAAQNGRLLGISIERDANAPGDTLTGKARVYLVEIDYTASG